jgi:acetoin utilization deacetylase AcuC-like enzyme
MPLYRLTPCRHTLPFVGPLQREQRWKDPAVLQFHTQERGIYPGSGKEGERGAGAAEGQILNIALEGGYDLNALGASAAATITELEALGRAVQPKAGPPSQPAATTEQPIVKP